MSAKRKGTVKWFNTSGSSAGLNTTKTVKEYLKKAKGKVRNEEI